MPTRKLKPDTPSRRFMSISTFEEITQTRPERKLTRAQLYSRVRKHGNRYQLLCANCNWRKRSQDFKKQKRRQQGFWRRLFALT